MVLLVEQKYTMEDFEKIIEQLRGENGCPWDRVQTHESLKPCVMEEAAELVSSIRIFEQTKSAENMCEELGDLLLQIVMHSQIAKEEGLFTLEDVIQGVSEKMIRRHPHVFAQTQGVDTPDKVLTNWDDIKKQEKEGKSWIASPLREIPFELPALTRAAKVLKKADKVYHYSIEETASLTDQAAALEQSVEETEQKEKTKALIGDILMRIAALAAREKLPLEQILTDRIEDVIEACEGAKIP